MLRRINGKKVVLRWRYVLAYKTVIIVFIKFPILETPVFANQKDFALQRSNLILKWSGYRVTYGNMHSGLFDWATCGGLRRLSCLSQFIFDTDGCGELIASLQIIFVISSTRACNSVDSRMIWTRLEVD